MDTDIVLMALVLRRDSFGHLDELARAFAVAAGMGEIRPSSLALQDGEFPDLPAQDAVLLCDGKYLPHALLAMRLPDWLILEMLWPASSALVISDLLGGRERAIVGRRVVRIRETAGWSMATESDALQTTLHSPWASIAKHGASDWLLTGPAQSQALHDALFRDHFLPAWLLLDLSHRYLLDDLRSAARVLPFLPLIDAADQTRLHILEKTKRDSLARWQGEMQRFLESFQIDRARSGLVAQYERVAEEIARAAAATGSMPEPDQETELTALLIDAFDGDAGGLRRWVRLGLGHTLHRELREDLSLVELAFQVMLAIRRHGLASPRLFESLSSERPALAQRIQDVARLWGVTVAR